MNFLPVFSSPSHVREDELHLPVHVHLAVSRRGHQVVAGPHLEAVYLPVPRISRGAHIHEGPVPAQLRRSVQRRVVDGVVFAAHQPRHLGPGDAAGLPLRLMRHERHRGHRQALLYVQRPGPCRSPAARSRKTCRSRRCSAGSPVSSCRPLWRVCTPGPIWKKSPGRIGTSRSSSCQQAGLHHGAQLLARGAVVADYYRAARLRSPAHTSTPSCPASRARAPAAYSSSGCTCTLRSSRASSILMSRGKLSPSRAAEGLPVPAPERAQGLAPPSCPARGSPRWGVR